MGKLKEGSKLPAALEVKVIEQPANALYLVLPTLLPEKLSDEALDTVAGGCTFNICKHNQVGCNLEGRSEKRRPDFFLIGLFFPIIMIFVPEGKRFFSGIPCVCTPVMGCTAFQ
ncbi:NHLP leader peptide domain-containing protein [Desulfosporosinus lacus DSM 15449]|uniref:NHLP leader peptide domain-containing protein n=2 Tax=Desulfosporosinus TaxID=79206 RepID=A0A1M5XDW0_9FIRM|nr:NHLP leader peptide domain-containing protein [Desulfosporosinus lacus DSM 15449]